MKKINNIFPLNSVFIYNAKSQHGLLFFKPVKIILTKNINDVIPALKEIENIVKNKKLFSAGFISYESASAFDNALFTKRSDKEFPLLWFGLYKKYQKIKINYPFTIKSLYSISNWKAEIRYETYKKNIEKIKNLLKNGETYQVNYTFKLFSQFNGLSLPFFFYLAHRSKACYCAYINLDNFYICSASPELFFEYDKNILVSKPMKGTARRGRYLLEDIMQKKWLKSSEKNKAENVMIVDMIRNDMGRIAEKGSVKVYKMFECEKYPTVWQMISTVKCKTKASLFQIFSTLFPCASITGAPKINTSKIISKLEKSPRKIYTGCIGYITPQKYARFNVSIRTAIIDKRENKIEYGVGGGIVWSSRLEEEYDECLTKAKILLEKAVDFSLLESILWTPQNGYFLLKRHLKRLFDSAEYFDFRINKNLVKKRLNDFQKKLSNYYYKVRLTVDINNKILINATRINNSNKSDFLRLKLACSPVNSSNPLLFNKTTNREIYNKILKDLKNCDDAILFNEKEEITETTRFNIVILKNGQLITPPVKCGLLPGTFRAHLLSQKKISEGIITKKDLKIAEKVFCINSVRKWCGATVIWED